MRAWVLGLALMAAPAAAKDLDQRFAVFGAGAASCGQYADTRIRGGEQEQAYVEWLLGYLSAFNLIVESTYDIAGGTDLDAVLNWLDEYCLGNRGEIFVNAVARLTEGLYPNRLNLAPVPEGTSRWSRALGVD